MGQADPHTPMQLVFRLAPSKPGEPDPWQRLRIWLKIGKRAFGIENLGIESLVAETRRANAEQREI